MLQRWYATIVTHTSSAAYDGVFVGTLLLAEVLLGGLIVAKVPYTEIDWQAYMEEVEAWWVDGQLDYREIRGATGPLVYPAGFLYLFGLLRHLTEKGTNIRRAQYFFLGFYVATQAIALLLYQTLLVQLRKRLARQDDKKKSQDADNSTTTSRSLYQAHVVWSWRIAMGILCLSKRIHSIFLLRLFNDGPTMLLLYLSVYLFTRQYWNGGCVVFSLAVSIKMNVLLFAPGLLLLLLQVGPTIQEVILVRLGLCCALPQLVLGAPFLLAHPVSYLRKAFELDRAFFYQWTVNLKFLSPEHFASKRLSLGLLACHLIALGLAAYQWIRQQQQQQPRRDVPHNNNNNQRRVLSPEYIVRTLAISNFIGICFARTLHYQFYAWYFHSLPLLLWPHATTNNGKSSFAYPLPVRLAILAAVEYAFLTFPATATSSALLQVAHLLVLCQVFWAGPPPMQTEEESSVVATDGGGGGDAVSTSSVRRRKNKAD